MASSIYYPRTVFSSQELAKNICPADMTSEEFEQKFLSANGLSAGNNSICPPNRPVAVPSADQGESVGLGPIRACTFEEQQTLAHLSRYAGGAAVMGLADLLWDTKIPNVIGDLNTFGGNGMGAAVAQSSKVLGAINKYDLANKNYEDMKNHRAAPRMVNAAKLRAQATFKEMNQILHAKSLNYLNNNTFRMRQTTNAAGRTVWESIPVRDIADVQKLSRLAKAGRVVGPGFIVLDGYLRANSVYHSRNNNDPNWELDFPQCSGHASITPKREKSDACNEHGEEDAKV
ncbi:hypothetical protein [Marinobacter caseinilyticus]|uniref:hypothetical protein n=1 Tax=Marinobacter caseinilyticus TaxID=2692195 RepID=UPI00140E701A|nr:hypothetical protein [Marinobacter caseinilyticus]